MEPECILDLRLRTFSVCLDVERMKSGLIASWGKLQDGESDVTS